MHAVQKEIVALIGALAEEIVEEPETRHIGMHLGALVHLLGMLEESNESSEQRIEQLTSALIGKQNAIAGLENVIDSLQRKLDEARSVYDTSRPFTPMLPIVELHVVDETGGGSGRYFRGSGEYWRADGRGRWHAYASEAYDSSSVSVRAFLDDDCIANIDVRGNSYSGKVCSAIDEARAIAPALIWSAIRSKWMKGSADVPSAISKLKAELEAAVAAHAELLDASDRLVKLATGLSNGLGYALNEKPVTETVIDELLSALEQLVADRDRQKRLRREAMVERDGSSAIVRACHQLIDDGGDISRNDRDLPARVEFLVKTIAAYRRDVADRDDEIGRLRRLKREYDACHAIIDGDENTVPMHKLTARVEMLLGELAAARRMANAHEYDDKCICPVCRQETLHREETGVVETIMPAQPWEPAISTKTDGDENTVPMHKLTGCDVPGCIRHGRE